MSDQNDDVKNTSGDAGAQGDAPAAATAAVEAAPAAAAAQPELAPAPAASEPAAAAPAASHPVEVLNTLVTQIRGAEKDPARAVEHGALVGLHAHLAELRNKLEHVGDQVGADVRLIVEHLRKVL